MPHGAGRGDNALAQQFVDLVAGLQHLVEIVLADDVAQRGQRELIRRGEYVGDVDDRLRRIDHFIPQRGVDPDRHAIAGDRFLRFDGNRLDANVDQGLRLNAERDQVIQTRPAHPDVAPQPKHDAALVLIRHAQTRNDDEAKNQLR